MKFSVLMSVYDKEKPDFLNQALQSVLTEQTRVPDEFIIVKDGPLTAELEKVINSYKSRYSDIVKVVEQKENKGLGQALRLGTERCTNELIARMDSDDISTNERFEKQVRFMEENPHISVVGAYISEFYEDPQNCKFTRIAPKTHAEIKAMLKKRNPMNHVTVMFRKSDLEKVGGYMHLPYLEDYYLWARSIGNNLRFHNLDEVLVLVRTGKTMYKRRSNPESINSWQTLQSEMLKLNLINRWNYFINMVNIIVFVYLPTGIKENIYKLFLRKKAS